MDNILTRLGLAVIAGLTFLAGAAPDGATLADLTSMPISDWAMFIVNGLTAFMSPSVIKTVKEKVVGK